MNHQFEVGALQNIKKTQLHIDDVLRRRIVGDHANKIGTPKSETARLWVRFIADVIYELFDPGARRIVYQR